MVGKSTRDRTGPLASPQGLAVVSEHRRVLSSSPVGLRMLVNPGAQKDIAEIMMS